MTLDKGLPLLVIVQNRETQFDAPLYSLICQKLCFKLEVFYTRQVSGVSPHDAELGFAPRWDHLQGRSYTQRHLLSTGPLAIWRLAWRLRRLRPQLVVICGYFPRCQLLLALFLRLLGQRIGLRSDNTLTHTTFHGLRGKLRQLGVGPIQRLFHTWHPVGDQALAYLHARSGVDRPSYRFAYAVDNDWFAAQSSEARRSRLTFLRELGWPDDAFVVLGIMKWTLREDPLSLVEAYKLLHQRVPRARLVLVGDGPLREAVHGACNPLDCCAHRPGYVPYSQLPDWYGRADVFVHPAPDEPWGVSVTEALACGVPVIAANGVGAAAEMLDPSHCVQVVANADHRVLAAELVELASDPQELQKRRASCKLVADRWHYRHTIEAFQRALCDC